MKYKDTIKTCGNCKYFKIIKKGEEIKDIVDTSYLISKCKIKGWQTKEYYLSNINLEIKNFDTQVCSFWKHWKDKKNNLKGEIKWLK